MRNLTLSGTEGKSSLREIWTQGGGGGGDNKKAGNIWVDAKGKNNHLRKKS